MSGLKKKKRGKKKEKKERFWGLSPWEASGRLASK